MRTVPVVLVLLATGLALPAMAQIVPNDAKGISSGAPKASNLRRSTEAPPGAVPGARARPDTTVPAGPGAADLPPTEALFDAINRGDIVTARDAITRGADLDGTNLLGLTPLELSVDLGRNDISFLLLSLRGASGSESAGREPTQADAGTPPTAAQRRKAVAEARAQARAAVAQAPRPARQGPALFAGDGGAPVPSAGFLGFDPHR